MWGDQRFCLICGQVNNCRLRGISCHKFPKNRENEWLELFHLTSESLKVKVEISQLCSRHFTPDCFTVAKDGSKRLKKDSTPTLRFIDEHDLRAKKIRLCKSPEWSGIDQSKENQQNNENRVIRGNDGNLESTSVLRRKYAHYAKTCILCRRRSDLELSFFTFPTDNRKETWLEACNISEPISANARICSRHFKISDFINPPGLSGRPILRKPAVPSIFFDQESTNNEKGPVSDGRGCDFGKLPDSEIPAEDGESFNLPSGRTINLEREDENFKINGDVLPEKVEEVMPETSANPHLLMKIDYDSTTTVNDWTETKAESHYVTFQTDRKIKTEQPDIENAKIDDTLNDGNGYHVTSETKIKMEDTNIDIEFKDVKLFDCEEQMVESHVESEFVDVKLQDEELNIKDEDETDQNLVLLEDKMFNCNECDYQSKDKGYLTNHLLLHKVQVFKCNVCSYQCKKKSRLKSHMLVHKDPSQMEMFKCNECNFQSKYKAALKNHQLVHKDPMHIEMFKCDECNYQNKHKSDLRRHMLLHKDPSHINIFKCTECDFESKHKGNLKKHLLLHKGPSEVHVFKCNACSYQFIRNSHLKGHMLVHEDPSQMEMFKCNECNFQSHYKAGLKNHLLLHKDPMLIKMFKCDLCNYQCKQKSVLRKHMLLHKDPMQIKMFKCDLCNYQCKYKIVLQRHMLVHKDPSQINMFKCHKCDYRNTHKGYLKKHLRQHNDPSQVHWLKCSDCSYQCIHKNNLKRHMLVHKDPSQMEM